MAGLEATGRSDGGLELGYAVVILVGNRKVVWGAGVKTSRLPDWTEPLRGARTFMVDVLRALVHTRRL